MPHLKNTHIGVYMGHIACLKLKEIFLLGDGCGRRTMIGGTGSGADVPCAGYAEGVHRPTDHEGEMIEILFRIFV